MESADLDAALLDLTDAQINAALVRRAQAKVDRARQQSATRMAAMRERRNAAAQPAKSDADVTPTVTPENGNITRGRYAASDASVAANQDAAQPSPAPSLPPEPPIPPTPSPASSPLTPQGSPAAAGRGKGKKVVDDDVATADPRHRLVFDGYTAAYLEAFGEPYAPAGGRDGAALKKLLPTLPPDFFTAERIVGTAREAMARTKEPYAKECKRAGALHSFCDSYNSIRAELKAHTEKPNANRTASNPVPRDFSNNGGFKRAAPAVPPPAAPDDADTLDRAA